MEGLQGAKYSCVCVDGLSESISANTQAITVVVMMMMITILSADVAFYRVIQTLRSASKLLAV